MAQIGQIVCRDKRDAKSIKIQECLAQLRHDTKQFDQTMRECCTEPGQRLETLYKNIDKSITHRDTLGGQENVLCKIVILIATN